MGAGGGEIEMDYFTYRRFKGKGIDGYFNLKYGTIVTERNNFLFAPDSRCICAVTSENRWGHFHPNTAEGRERQKMLDRLYKFYGHPRNAERFAADFQDDKWPGATNHYWKSLLRTMKTDKLRAYYLERMGDRNV